MRTTFEGRCAKRALSGSEHCSDLPAVYVFDLQRAERVLVTGAAGFVGSTLAQKLAGEGRAVLGLDNFDPYYDPALKRANAEIVAAAGGQVEELDLGDFDGVTAAMRSFAPDVVVHLAAKAGVRASVAAPRNYFFANVVGTQNVLDACRETGTNRLVFASTSSVYGNTEVIPFDEGDPCLRPLHPYATTKRTAEMLIRNYSDMYGLQATVLRLFTVYGERGRPDMMPRMLLESITTGREIPLFEGPLERDWTHVSDICSGLTAAADRPTDFAVMNLGGGAPVSLAAFIAELERVSGNTANLKRSERPASEMMTTFASTKLLEANLGFRPSVSVEEGIARLWAWWIVDQGL